MLSFGLRLLLLAGSVLTFTYILYSVRKAKMQIDYCVFWLLFGVLLVVFAIFPRLVSELSWALGFESPSNFIFLAIIFVLLLKLFTTTVKLSKMDQRLTELAQHIALREEQESAAGRPAETPQNKP